MVKHVAALSMLLAGCQFEESTPLTNSDNNDTDCANDGGRPDATRSDAGESSGNKSNSDASPLGPDGGNSQSGGALCAPGVSCGGIISCTDHCFGAECCVIRCTCGGNDTLYCDMTCN